MRDAYVTLCRCEEGFCSSRRSNLPVVRRLLRQRTKAPRSDILLGLLHGEFAPKSHIRCVINFTAPLDVILGLRRETRAERSGVGDGEVEGV